MLRKFIYSVIIGIGIGFTSPIYAVTENGINITYWRNNPVVNGVAMPGTFGKTAAVFTAYVGTGTVAYNSTGTSTATSCRIDVRGFEEFTLMLESLNVGAGTNTFVLTGYKGTRTSNVVTVNHTTAKSETIPISEKYLDFVTVGYSSTGTGSNASSVTFIAGSKEK